MKVKELMTPHVIDIGREEPVAVAARALTHYNIGILPVRNDSGELCGVLTDRDIVTRCLAANRDPERTKVQDVMTAQIHAASPDMEVSAAAHMMGRRQIRRLPVVENGRLCGVLSLGDLAGSEESAYDAVDALSDITGNVSNR